MPDTYTDAAVFALPCGGQAEWHAVTVALARAVGELAHQVCWGHLQADSAADHRPSVQQLPHLRMPATPCMLLLWLLCNAGRSQLKSREDSS